MFRHLASLIGAAAVVGGGLAAIHFGAPPAEPPTDDVVPASVLRTAVVPTLDTPTPDGQSAVWCASFQLAWDKLKADVARGPVEITGAADVCGRLNKAAYPTNDLPTDGTYAAAGFERDGILGTIAADLAEGFPKAAKPALVPVGDSDALHAFGYLEATVRFTWPYYANPETFQFRLPDGKLLPFRSFGLPRVNGLYVDHKAEDQPEVLFHETARGVTEFAVDLDRKSAPVQVVLARVGRQRSLAESLARVDDRIRSFATQPGSERYRSIGHNETLLVPEMSWNVRHEFPELTGPGHSLKFNGQDLPVRAEQVIRFRLDRHGAEMKSDARMMVTSKMGDDPRRFEFDRPFLLYLKKRGAGRPFFVLWVENAELLCPPGS